MNLSIVFAIMFTLALVVGLIDLNLRSSKPLINIKPVRIMWLCELIIYGIGVATVICFALGKPNHALMCITAVAGLFGPIVFREVFEGVIVARHAPNHPYAKKKLYRYSLRKDSDGNYSFHYMPGSSFLFRSRNSDMSLRHCTDSVMDLALAKLKKGDTITIITANKALRQNCADSLWKYFCKRGFKSECLYSETLPPIVGLWLNIWHRWKLPLLSRVTLRGKAITL